ncbi:hypothetical protein C1933_02110 [Stenotrophomonas sp. ZAC14D2_NAIMI4_6]|nr:hypothetical protein C1933_02110 [Stenotrophomonas sp. ZAC14D2_NAIMI4_6]
MGCARYAAEPLESYTEGMLQQLARIEASVDAQGAMQGAIQGKRPRLHGRWALCGTCRTL